jgi:hypothetical protein
VLEGGQKQHESFHSNESMRSSAENLIVLNQRSKENLHMAGCGLQEDGRFRRFEIDGPLVAVP